VLLGLHNLTVIHGKETGVLRENIQSFLRADKRVRTFRSGV
jgi:dsDNA-specific endonuclease/ATPase MutS2